MATGFSRQRLTGVSARCIRSAVAVAAAAVLSVVTAAAAASPDARTLATWVALDAPTGHEHHAADALREVMDGWSVDRMGNLSKTVGEGEATVLVACLLDAPSFTVSQIRDDGYLRLHAAGTQPSHPLWPQFHEGQQLRILTRGGPVIGVSALANGHFMNLHRDEAVTRADDLWLDVGATSRRGVEQLGIALLDPVIRHLPAWAFADWMAGPAAGARIGCATVVAAAEAGVTGAGRTRYVLAAGSAFSGLGLNAAAAAVDGLEQVVLLGPGVNVGETPLPAKTLLGSRFTTLDFSRLTVIQPEVENAAGLMERVHVGQAATLAAELLSALGVATRELAWGAAPAPAAPRNPELAVDDIELGGFARQLTALGELYAVSGFESPVHEAVKAALPPWAQALMTSDEMGNLWVDTGPADEDATVFMAHMDEVGWRITAIHRDGRVALARRGGALSLAREGQPAMLQITGPDVATTTAEPAMLRGVFLTRREVKKRWPDSLEAWFGMDREELLAAGVTVGMPVTGYKEAHRLGPYRFSVRGMDDRVGTAALLSVIAELDPAQLAKRVIFAWSVQEENGLHGARAMAQRFGRQTRRIYSIDTFVTSDTPLESPHFAFATLGEGPVLRSMENTGLVRPEELDRNRRIARDAGIDVQIGMTQGGTDGTAFTYLGAPNAGLSWPGRYSHGPAELGDLRDMRQLVDLIKAFTLADP
jgi:putative aminopeptidase FrvX